MTLSRCKNIGDLRKVAKSRLPAPMFHYIDGGADDEWSMRRNVDAFDNYELLPNYLKNIETIDLTTTLLGEKLDMPLLLAPTGMSRLFHHDKETGVANAASRFGVMYALSTVGTASIEDIAAIDGCPKMFQIYILKDRGLTTEFVERCKEACYAAMCLTVDTPLAGNRERDLVTGMTLPPRFGVKSLLSFAVHVRWALNLLRHRDFQLANVKHRIGEISAEGTSLVQWVNNQFDRTVTWDDAAWLVEQWPGPFVIKGLQTAEDAKRAADIGAQGIMISNHGGRQLDSTPAPIDCLAEMRDAIGDSLELIVDGGIRRGTHILKAMAMGADACSIGRPYLYGLAAGGQAGVERSLHLLREELLRDMALLGCTSLAELTQAKIRRVQ